MSHTTSFLSELAEITNAATRLPAVETELAKVQGELAVTRQRLDDAFMGQSNLEAQIYALRSELAAKEAALSDATFREGETRDKLQMLLGTFRSVIGDASAAVELVEPPKPEPVVAPAEVSVSTSADSNQPSPMQPSGETLSTIWHSRSGSRFDDDDIVKDRDSGQSASHPTPATPVDSTTGTTGNSAGIDDSNTPTDLPGVYPWTQEATRESETTQSASMNVKPFAGLSYWLKPDNMTWAAWIADGGDKAPWVSIDGTDRYHEVIDNA